ncbi:MAG: sigma-54-dependent Fis family transcriptional regulator, partial [Deltaproteobacteria bacterium]
FGSIERAVEAMKRGAFDYLTKPFQRDDLKQRIARALKVRLLEAENRRLQGELQGVFSFEKIIWQSPAMAQVVEVARRVATSDATVLLTGESGTGKELFARAIHYASPRAGAPFVAVNCSAIPRELLESELFGYVRGAFTGAHRDHKGKFEQAHGGTIFFDEIGDLDPAMQVKLLRVLETREVERIGEEKSRRVDLRIIAATNVDLEGAIAEGNFREDLFFRLSVIPIHLPPLRERREDILLLAHHFLRRFAPDQEIVLSPEARTALEGYPWRGNVRELANVCEWIVTLRRGNEITREDLPEKVVRQSDRTSPPERGVSFTADALIFRLPDGGIALDTLIRDILVAALEKNDWNQSKTARFLKIPRHILLYRMSKYDITPPQDRS